MKPTFKGISENGDIHEALQDAILNAKETLETDYVEWWLEKISGKNGGFVLQNLLEVQISVSGPSASTAYFECTDNITEQVFVIKLVEEDKIEHARKILSGMEKGKIHIQGQIIKECVPYNTNWSFHLYPKSIDFFEYAIEVCDAAFSYVEENLDDVGGAFLPNNHWCPWSSKLVKEIFPADTNL